jgi:exosome complex component RRP41
MGIPDPSLVLVDPEGRRLDGRGVAELRPLAIEAGVLNRAEGSCYLEWGRNKVLAGVYGPHEFNPKHLQRNDKAVLRVRYTMAAFSTMDRKRPGPDRRSQEIGKVIADALESVVLTRKFPRCAIDVNVEILESAAGTRCAALTAASVALADAGIPMTGLVAAVAAGKVSDTIVLDLAGREDTMGQADLPIGINQTTGEVVLAQMDGHMTPQEFEEAIDLASQATPAIHALQREALTRAAQRRGH